LIFFLSPRPLFLPSNPLFRNTGSSVLALGRTSGETHLVDPDTGRTLAKIPPPAAAAAAAVAPEEAADAAAGEARNGGDGVSEKPAKKKSKGDPVRGLSFLYDAAGTGCTRFPLLVVASASGKVRVFSPPAGFFPPPPSPSAPPAAASPSSASSPWSLVSKFDAAPKGGLRALSLAHSPGGSSGGGGGGSVVRVAVVADTAELTVWDLASREKAFEAKGERPDRLRLVDRVGGTAVCFLPDSDDQTVAAPRSPGGARCSGTLVAVGTGTGRVRLYDTRHGRRPVASVVLSGDGGGGKAGCSTSAAAAATPVRNNGLSGAGAAVTTLAPEAGGAAFSRVWAGDSAGLLRSVDLRTARPEGVLKGATGGVRAAAPHPRAALVASAGADGFLRVHHARTRKLVGSLWLKQPLRSVCWCPVAAAAAAGAREGEKEEKKKSNEKKKSKKRRRRSDDGEEDASSSSSVSDEDDDDDDGDDDDEQSFLEASKLTLLPPEEKGKRKKKKKAVPPPLPGGKKEKKVRKKGGSAKKNKLRKEAAKQAKQAKYEAARGGRGRGGGGGGE
jgi:hypothetical protein